MIPKHRIWLSALALAIALSSLLVPVSAQQKYRTTEEIWGAKFGYTSYKYRYQADKASGLTGLRRWNQIAIDASGLDHTRLLPARIGHSASNSARAAPRAPLRSFRSQCSRLSTPL
ncbi:MAG: hypothetical protein IPF53_06595 [Blastocatellia bacterium]|nr:hypothetical protein [Blastocatellia bacterium]